MGKNLQFMAKTLVASFIGVPGRFAASQMSRLVSEQASLQSASWMGSALSRSKYSRMTQPGDGKASTTAILVVSLIDFFALM